MQPHRGRTRCAVRYASAAEISDVLTCAVPPLRVESSLRFIKKTYSQLLFLQIKVKAVQSRARTATVGAQLKRGCQKPQGRA
jgi:hypothetical protein